MNVMLVQDCCFILFTNQSHNWRLSSNCAVQGKYFFSFPRPIPFV